MTGSLTAVREKSVILLKVRELSGKNFVKEKCPNNCLLLVAYLRPLGYLVAPS